MTPTYQGELMLAGWSETHTGGAKVTFWLPDADALDTFRSMTVRKGNTAGQRFMAVLVEVGADEQPLQPEGVRAKGGVLSKDAALICENSDFQRFASERSNYWSEGLTGNQNAAEYVRTWCRINSRAELDHSPTARQLFGQLMSDFRAWQAGS